MMGASDRPYGRFFDLSIAVQGRWPGRKLEAASEGLEINALDRLDHLPQRDRLRLFEERDAPARPALGADQTDPGKRLDDLAEVCPRHSDAAAELLRADGGAGWLGGQVHDDPDCVVSLQRELHSGLFGSCWSITLAACANRHNPLFALFYWGKRPNPRPPGTGSLGIAV